MVGAMLKSLLRRSIAWVVVLAVAVAMAASAWAAFAADGPWHPLTTALGAGVDAVDCGECRAHHHHPAQAAHSHCLSCLGFPLPIALIEFLPIRPAGFTFGSRTVFAGLPAAPDPDPPRTLSPRI
jgi:hypothetical protein